MADKKPLNDDQAAEIAEPLEEALAEIKALLNDLDRDDYVSEEGWTDCLDRIEEHLRATRALVRNL